MCHNYDIFNRSVILTSCGSRYGSGSVIIPVLTTYVCEIKTTIFFVCLFVCLLEFIVPLENFSLIWRRHHCRWRAANFYVCSALMAIEQLGFFNVPHLLLHGPTLYNGHLRHSHMLPSVWQWRCHYLLLRLRSIATGVLYVPSLVEISPVVLEAKLLKFVDVFLLFRYYFPLE